MTMDEHGELEYRLMMEKSERNKIKQEETERAEAELSRDYKEERQRVKDSLWNDWKDDHEKGAGNKKRNI